MTIATVNPATGETLKTFEPYDEAEIERRLELSASAARAYRHSTLTERAELVNRLADLFIEDLEPLARTMTTEMGKPITQSRGEVNKCAAGLRYYAEHAARMLADEQVPGTVARRGSYVKYQPLGPVLAVMPWNFPLWQVIRFAAPALMAGNTALLKHASNVPQVALYLEDASSRAGFPDGVFQTLLVGTDQVPRILEDDRVKAATLTGSEGAGRAVASIAGRAIKKTVLELGGSDPFVVMPSADIAQAVEVGLWARVQNNGQSCIAAKRFILHEEIAEEFESRFAEAMSALVIGDPLDDATQIGPLATEQGMLEVNQQVGDAVGLGAKALCGAEVHSGPGWYVSPTALCVLEPAMRVYREEVFGPVASMFKVRDIDEAIALANDSDFGLGSNAWTEDEAEQSRFAEELEAGMVFINSMTTSYFDLPFGGVKRSGYGRELTHHGLREFTVIKTVFVN